MLETRIPVTEIRNERDYVIRKGKVLERFQEDFFENHYNNSLYRRVLELLIRDADPYLVIEQLIEINEEQYKKMYELVQLLPPQKINKP